MRLNDPPEPIAPSMLDVHAIEDVSLPSCESLAEPANEIVAPFANEALLPGDEMDTVGAVFLLVDVGGYSDSMPEMSSDSNVSCVISQAPGIVGYIVAPATLVCIRPSMCPNS